ncbi:hypothetical protein Thi970DRAFT_02177 [Thiorhodovibrio frisius]|uniref:Uncharacterized protein n=1 Tax=Thiorhodovibrio frisius TaxID=631362 RepID=H8YZ14_9GAMM|nr:hypothetical protein Thi970DRAFT_02177 [Thiorhodovibrio frisius]WPL24230.1 hypothetical protein Thiofri_04446 [Thiorhodovibrio frisius]
MFATRRIPHAHAQKIQTYAKIGDSAWNALLSAASKQVAAASAAETSSADSQSESIPASTTT